MSSTLFFKKDAYIICFSVVAVDETSGSGHLISGVT